MKKLNLINQKFGTLTVLKESGKTPAGHITFLCKCQCGKEVERTGTSLVRSTYSSCGSKHDQYNGSCLNRPSGKNSPHWKGYGEISATWFFNVVQRAASGRKSRSGIEKKIDIDIEYIWNLFLKQNRKCAFTGLELTFPTKNTNEEYKKATASLDRIDSSKGYIKGNLQWVHKKINIMKNTMSDKEFRYFCNLVK